MNPATILKPVVLVTIGPTALGMGLARLYPGAAPRLAGLANRVGGVVLLLVAPLLALPLRALPQIGRLCPATRRHSLMSILEYS